MLRILLILSLTISAQAQDLQLFGSIGPYAIEMILKSSSDEDYNVQGKYRYQNKKDWLTLKGNYYNPGILELEEYYNGQSTGTFYIEVSDTNKLSLNGKWIGAKKWHPSTLTISSGNLNFLEEYTIESLQQSADSAISGTYRNESYFINDFWFTDEHPQLQIGFNGGTVSVKELNRKGALHIYFEKVCGPTFHMAYFDDTVYTTDNKIYIYNQFMDMGDEQKCHLEFKFENKEVFITQHSSSYSCGFGARAYAGGASFKISNDAINSTQNVRQLLLKK